MWLNFFENFCCCFCYDNREICWKNVDGGGVIDDDEIVLWGWVLIREKRSCFFG